MLLIDDEPSGLGSPVPRLTDGAASGGLPDGTCGSFEFRWLATSEEVREYRDLTNLIASHDPEEVGAHGWVPDIVLVDYELSNRKSLDRRSEVNAAVYPSLSPLPALRAGAARLDPLRFTQIRDHATAPGTDPTGTNNDGCIAGLMVLLLYPDCPCAPVVTTFKSDGLVKDTDAALLQWYLSIDTYGAFQACGSRPRGWSEPLRLGVATLRQRIADLARSNRLQLSLQELLKLSDAEPEAVGFPTAVSLFTPHGRRSLSINGLFADAGCKTDEPETVRRARARNASHWAKTLLESAFPEDPSSAAYAGTISEFTEACRAAEAIWGIYRSSQVDEYRHVAERALNQPSTASKCEGSAGDLRTIKDPRVCRWTALMLVLRLEHLLADCKAYVEGADAPRTSSVQAVRLHALNANDCYLALFPTPNGECTLHLKKMASGTYSKFLNALHTPESEEMRKTVKYGDLGLHLPDLLEGRRHDPERVILGLRPAEQRILQWHAGDLGFQRNSWPDWLRKPLHD